MTHLGQNNVDIFFVVVTYFEVWHKRQTEAMANKLGDGLKGHG